MRAAATRIRDGGRCRGCNREEEEVRLEVHHRVYGEPGACGNCVLTGVGDEDLLTLCVDCHDAITNVRRHVRYSGREITASVLEDPQVHRSAVPTRQPVDVGILANTRAHTKLLPRRLFNQTSRGT